MADAIQIPGKAGQKIVVVDDEPSMCAMVASMLEEAGYAPAVTTDPRTAVDLVRREKPVLVLIDISMPHMDGYALMEALQADPATSGCPVMFVTGNLSFSERMQAYQRGVRDYVAKPFTAEKLLMKIARVLSDLEAKVPS
jgi:twitching motility two-component system response regulator PilH